VVCVDIPGKCGDEEFAIRSGLSDFVNIRERELGLKGLAVIRSADAVPTSFPQGISIFSSKDEPEPR
jgi:hypothetical protein